MFITAMYLLSGLFCGIVSAMIYLVVRQVKNY